LVAAKSMRRPFMGEMFKWAKSIPVERGADLAKKGNGKIEFLDAVTVRGIDTSFTTEFG